MADWKNVIIAEHEAELATLRARVEELERDRNYWKVEAQGERAKVERRDTKLSAANARIERLEALVEQAFRDGLAYATNCKVTDPDLAWQQSRARATLSRLTEMGESDG